MKGVLTVFESAGDLAKTYRLDDAGKLVKTTAAQMTHGRYEARGFETVNDLATLLGSVTTRQAVCASLALDGSHSGRIVTQKALSGAPGELARTKTSFGLERRPGFLFIDHDAPAGAGGMARDELWQLLQRVCPALAGAGVVWRPSGSSHICNGDADLTGQRGQHLFVMTADTSDAPRVVKILAARLWLAGFGQVIMSKAGSLLVRCPLDTSPTDSARLIFAGGAVAVAPLEQRRGAPVILSDGGWLDSLADVPDLTPDEQGRYEALVEQAKAAAMPEALRLRAEHKAATVARRLPGLMAAGASASEAEARIGAAVDAAYGGVLLGDAELTVVHADGKREVVTVGQVLCQRDRFEGADCLDPLNPGHRGGTADARLFLMSASPIVYSLDSLAVFRLRAQQTRLSVARGARSELVAELSAAVADLDNVFATDAGPVLLEPGRRLALTDTRLMNLVGGAIALFTKTAKGEAPTDLTRETAQLVLAGLT